jgi:RNA polymerase sigma factor (TIGR02999 family)
VAKTVMPRQRISAQSHTAGAGGPSERGDPFASDTRQSLDDRFSVMYAELRRLAASVKRNDPNSLVSTGTLVHEAWSKLARSSGESPQSELHFKSIAACAMRQILKDAARRQRSGKRGGGNLFITLDESIGVPVSSNEDLLQLDAALDTLAEMSPRQAKLVELRYYGGLNNSEIEALLGIGERTVERDWRAARAWLAAEIRGEFR